MALPPPVVIDVKPLAVPELVTVSFWFAPAATSVKVSAVPELVQVLSVAVAVQANCAAAGELAKSAMAETVAAQHSAPAEGKKLPMSTRQAAQRYFPLSREQHVCNFCLRTRIEFPHEDDAPPPIYCCSIGELARL